MKNIKVSFEKEAEKRIIAVSQNGEKALEKLLKTDEKIGCVGCYQYDPVEYRKSSAERIATEAVKKTVDYVMKKLYGEDK